MRIAVAGGLGFLGRNIVSHLISKGHDVTVFDNIDESSFNFEGACYVKSDLTLEGSWQKFIVQQDVIINLAGMNIFQRWNENKKKKIYDSRILATEKIINALNSNVNNCKLLINASAVGYYGFGGDEEIDETGQAGDDFLANVSKDWENQALKGANSGLRVVLLRFGTIFGKTGGAFPELRKNFRRRIGAKLGSGNQWFPWIHVDDIVRIVCFVVSNTKISGPVNCVSPHGVTNEQFTEIMKNNMGSFSFIPFVPGFLLRIVLGEFGSFLTKGQRVVPKCLNDAGYSFKFNNLDDAVKNLLQ